MKTVLLTMLSLASFAAFAQTPTASTGRTATDNPSAASTARAAARASVARDVDRDVDRLCLRETGTRIRASRTTGAHCPNAQAGRVYTQEDLRSTGRVDVADMLRTLDPSIR